MGRLLALCEDNLHDIFEFLNHDDWESCSGVCIRLSRHFCFFYGKVFAVRIMKDVRKITPHAEMLLYPNYIASGLIEHNDLKTLRFFKRFFDFDDRRVSFQDHSGVIENESCFLISAVSQGHYDMMSALMYGEFGFRCVLTPRTMMVAVISGNMVTVMALHFAGCPWDARSTAQAARLGHEDILCWLISNGCPFDLESLI